MEDETNNEDIETFSAPEYSLELSDKYFDLIYDEIDKINESRKVKLGIFHVTLVNLLVTFIKTTMSVSEYEERINKVNIFLRDALLHTIEKDLFKD